jgi:allantoinase
VNQDLYPYSPIVARPRLEWPDGARVAFYIGLNIEHYHVDKPATSASMATIGLVPDPMNYGWRDYGVRVGIWRLIDLLDRVGMAASVLVNSEVCEHYPQIVEAGVERGWAWLGHGQTNSRLHTGFDEEDERAYLAEMHDAIATATGTQPRGWLGPAMTETFDTPRLLRELGYTYLLDWCNDDQPYALNVEGMISVPYSVELNDISLWVGRNFSGEDYVRWVTDHLDQLLEDGETTGRVMALPLHPFIVNQPARHKYLARVLDEIAGRDGVWVTTSDAIAEHYLADHRPAASATG